MRSSFTAACCALRPASFSLEIRVVFCPGKPVAALRFLALTKGLLRASATKAVSWAGLDTHHKPVPLHLPICQSLRYFYSRALAVDFETLHSSPAVLTLNPPSSASDDALTNRPVMVNHHDKNEEGIAWTLSWPFRYIGWRTTLMLTNPFHFPSLFGIAQRLVSTRKGES
jgi:hypothetical protein